MEQKNLILMSKFLPRLYVMALLGGAYAGFNGVVPWGIDISTFLENPSILSTLAFPAYGTLLGMLWLGIGPMFALFFSGVKDGLAIKSYLVAGGKLYFTEAYVAEKSAAVLLGVGVGLVESLSLLYAATGGMYLAVYLVEVYIYGSGAEGTQKINFARKMAVSLFLAAIAVGLRFAIY